MDIYEKALELHKKTRGKLDINCSMPLENAEDLIADIAQALDKVQL